MRNIRMLTVAISILVLTGCATVPRLPGDEEARLNSELESIISTKPASANPDDTEIKIPENLVSESGFIWPIKNTVLNNMGTGGINIKAKAGEPVKAVKSGVVSFVSERFEGYGKIINIKHTDGFVSVYAYNSEILVQLNQVVKQGDIIAKAGQTGRAETPELHFRLFHNEQPVNPMSYLP
ncbi:MAG: M23 family metallopeptidase [Candidatus Brocadiia bacterium]